MESPLVGGAGDAERARTVRLAGPWIGARLAVQGLPIRCDPAERMDHRPVLAGAVEELEVTDDAGFLQRDAGHLRGRDAPHARGRDRDAEARSDQPQDGEPMRCLVGDAGTEAVFLAQNQRLLECPGASAAWWIDERCVG